MNYGKDFDSQYSGPELFIKSRPKKLVKSNNSISQNFFLTKFHCQFYTNNLHYKAPKAKQIASGVKLKIRGNGKIHIVMSCHYHMVMTFYHVAMKLPLPLPHGKMSFYYYVAMVRVLSLPCCNDISPLLFITNFLKLFA